MASLISQLVGRKNLVANYKNFLEIFFVQSNKELLITILLNKYPLIIRVLYKEGIVYAHNKDTAARHRESRGEHTNFN